MICTFFLRGNFFWASMKSFWEKNLRDCVNEKKLCVNARNSGDLEKELGSACDFFSISARRKLKTNKGLQQNEWVPLCCVCRWTKSCGRNLFVVKICQIICDKLSQRNDQLWKLKPFSVRKSCIQAIFQLSFHGEKSSIDGVIKCLYSTLINEFRKSLQPVWTLTCWII